MAVKPMNIVGTVNILDRGDGPAQEVLSRTARNRAQRQQDETRNELTKITDRVEKTLGQFDLVAKAEEEAKNNKDANMTYVNDIDELYNILGDQIKKRKYQQQVTVFIVGYQNSCNTRLKLIQQVNEFFNDTTNRWDEEELNPSTPDVDLDEVQKSITDSLDTARDLTTKIADINKEMIDYMYQYANAKAGNKNRKKLEKALSQAKDDVQMMSEKLLSIQRELEEKDEKIQSLYRQVEVKTMEAQRYKTAAEVAKKSLQETNAKETDSAQKDKEMKDLQKKVDMLTLELAQKDASRESSQKEMLSTGRENVMKIRELEEKINKTAAEHQAQIRDINDYNDRQLVNLTNANRKDIQEIKASYEEDIAKLKQGSEKQSAELLDVGFKYRELEGFRDSLNNELTAVKATLQTQLVKEADLISEREILAGQIADLTRAPPSTRTVSATSSRASDALRSDTDQDVKGRVGAKKKTKGAESIPDEEPVLKLEPEPAEVQLPEDFDNEEKWASYPMAQAQSAFVQYRQFAHSKVKELEIEVINVEGKTEKKVNTLKGQFHEHKSKWYAERSLLINQIELSQRLMGDAEKDADGVLAQLEEFVVEAEQLENEEQSSSLKRQSDVLAARKPPTPPSPVKEPTPEVQVEEEEEVEGAEAAEAAPAEEDLLQQTDDAKAELKSRDGDLSAPASRKGRRSVTFTEEVASIRRTSSSIKSAFSDRHRAFERIISNLKMMMKEESLDVVQQNALALLRSSIRGEGDEVEHSEHSLAMFGLASQISAESVYLGYKPDSLFSTILSMYYRAVDEYNLTISKMGEDSEPASPVISDLTKLLAVEHGKSPGAGVVMLKPATPDNYSPELEDTDSAKVRLASRADSPPPKTPTTINSSANRASATLEIDRPDSGRSTPQSRLSSKYRASIEVARQSIAERRSTSPRLTIPDKASFEDAELDENADMPEPAEKIERSTSIGSSFNATYPSRSGKSVATSDSAPKSSAQSKTPSSDQTRPSSTKTLRVPSSVASVPLALGAQTPAISVYEKSTAVTPLHTIDRTTSYSVNKGDNSSDGPTGDPLVNEYLKLYNNILTFKDGLAKILLDKDMMSASQVLSEIEARPVDEDQPLTPQVEALGQSCESMLADCGLVVQDALQAAFREDYNVSSVVSRGTSNAGDLRSVSDGYGMAPVPPTSSPAGKRKPSAGLKRLTPVSIRHTPIDTANFTELQQSLLKLQEEFDAEVQNHQVDVNHNTAIVMELQDTVAELRRELAIVKEEAEAREIEESDHESPIMFTRLDAERNAKNLKRAMNNNKLTEEKYNDAVEKMDAYISLPAKRMAELVKKYVHHKNMLRIEDIIKNRQDLDDSDMDMLERMENLQNLRTKRWMDKMDELAGRRADLASDLMESLEELEQESGIFMIKPMFSYRAFMTSAKHLRPKKSDEFPAQRMGVPVPSQPENQATVNYHNPRDSPEGRWVSTAPKTGGTWNMSASLPSGGDGLDVNMINTPRILELDVNRMMYGQNQVSMKSNPYLSHDRLVNAANSSTRSYMTVSRPVASNNRPASSGALTVSKSVGDLPDAPKRADSAEALIRMRSTPPLPPIARNNTLAPPETAERLNTGRDSSVNPSRLAREFTDDSIHLLPSHVTKIVTNSKSLSREHLLMEEPAT